jgi:hypothetical protein
VGARGLGALALIGALCLPTWHAVRAEEVVAPPRLVLGVLAHDYGPISDRYESGVDINVELQWTPRAAAWRWLGWPQLRLGLTPSFAGETSIVYGDLAYEGALGGRSFIAGSLGLALHNGPLHQKDTERCTGASDCGFGSRVLPHLSIELGYRWGADQFISVYLDHVSHLGLLSEENEGIDHLGLRYGFAF